MQFILEIITVTLFHLDDRPSLAVTQHMIYHDRLSSEEMRDHETFSVKLCSDFVTSEEAVMCQHNAASRNVILIPV